MLADILKTRPFMSAVDTEIEEISQRILLELESATSTELSDATYAKMILRLSDVNYTKKILQQVESITPEDKREIGKRAIIKVMLLSTWLQRLYFIIRAFIMAQISAVIVTAFVIYYGSINVMTSFLVGIFVFVFSLFITRIFDKQITSVTKKIVGYLAGHRAIRDFVMNHF